MKLLLLSLLAATTLSLVLATTNTTTHGGHCENIYSQPDPCNYVRQNCQTYHSLIPYLPAYFCASTSLLSLLSLLMDLLIMVFLFLFIGTASGDYFCPNLNTIASMLGLSENLTGVTFLAFGNGSPDLFATFTAIQSGASSLAIGYPIFIIFLF